MTTPRNKHLLFNWIFFAGLILLAVNDHYLKSGFPGPVTGKLSDIAGLLIFPLFLAYVFPRHWKFMPLITGLIFMYWKSPMSSPLIASINQYTPARLTLTRTIDYSDLWCLAVLPLSQRLIPIIDRFRITGNIVPRLSPLWLVVPGSLIFMSTSAPYTYRHQANGSVYVGKTYRLDMSKEQVLDAMRSEGFNPQPDTGLNINSSAYVLQNVKFPYSRDSIQSIQFTLTPEGSSTTALTIGAIRSTGDVQVDTRRLIRMYRKYYRHLIKNNVITPMKK